MNNIDRRPELHQNGHLPELARFIESPIAPGEPLDMALATTQHHIAVFTSSQDAQAADAYLRVIGRNNNGSEIMTVTDPIQEASQIRDPRVVPLVVHDATDPVLFQKMFAEGPGLGQLLMGEVYMERPDHESSSLHVIGASSHGLDLLSRSAVQPNEELLRELMRRRREVLGENRVSNHEFRDILKSPKVHKIIAHALGPKGTNISQAMEMYIKSLGVEGKTELVVHPSGIEPLEYAQMAAAQVEEGVIPVHMECAVFYALKELDQKRSREVTFADHQHMWLDAMQLASVTPIDELAANGRPIVIATHPSPRPLIGAWEKAGRAEWIKATSNTAAAEMVMNGQAEACITTASSFAGKDGLTSHGEPFGSPNMTFNIATSLNQEQLRWYRQ